MHHVIYSMASGETKWTLGWISLKKIKSKINELEFFTYIIYSISPGREVAFDAEDLPIGLYFNPLFFTFFV